MSDLHQIASHLNNLWAEDASPGTLAGYFRNLGAVNPADPALHLAWRRLVMRADLEGTGVAGMILHTDTLFQEVADGVTFVDALRARGIIPIAKVDLGISKVLGKIPITRGLDRLLDPQLHFLEGLRERGVLATKWRAALAVADWGEVGVGGAFNTNTELMNYYAQLCVEADLAPIQEPEILYAGAEHSIQECADCLGDWLSAIMNFSAEVGLNGQSMVLKTNMVTAGKEVMEEDSDEKVAEISCKLLADEALTEHYASVVYLSGGHSPSLATSRYNAIVVRCKTGPDSHILSGHPLPGTSFSRARDMEAMAVFAIDPESSLIQERAIAILNARSRAIQAASRGEYTPEMEFDIDVLKATLPTTVI